MIEMVKDPDARLDYTVDWTSWLVDGDTVASVEWLPDPGITTDTQTVAGARATVWLSGGVAGRVHRVVCRVTTTAGRVDDRTLRIRVLDR